MMEAIYLKEVHEKNNILKLFFKFVQGQILNDVHMKIKYINLILIIYIYIYICISAKCYLSVYSNMKLHADCNIFNQSCTIICI